MKAETKSNIYLFFPFAKDDWDVNIFGRMMHGIATQVLIFIDKLG